MNRVLNNERYLFKKMSLKKKPKNDESDQNERFIRMDSNYDKNIYFP